MDVTHGFMYRVAWNCVDHMVACMDMHGSVMNSDPGSIDLWTNCFFISCLG